MSKDKENSIDLKRIFPFLNWIGKLKDPKVLMSDIIAGFTVAFVLVPQSMAYADLAGLPITVGLFTAFIPVLVAGLFGSSRQMSTGPVTIVSLMTATALAPIAVTSPEGYVVYASLLAFFIGLFYLLLSFLRLGVIVEFLSHPVVLAFTNAIAIITITSQAGKIFDVSYDKGNNYFQGLYNLAIATYNDIHLMTFLIGLLSIALLVFLKTAFPKLPRVLILLVLATTGSYYLGLDLKIVGDIPSNLPEFSMPFLDPFVLGGLGIDQILNLAFFAAIIGLIGFTESISVAKFISTKTKQSVSANRELVGQGLANISSSLFGGFGVAGSFSKTAVNLRAGAKTGFASVVTGMVVGITIIFLTPYLFHLPMVTLAAVIIVAVSGLIKINPIIKAWKTEKHDGIVAIITFSLTLILAPNVEIGILVGVVLSLALYISRTMRPRVIEVAMYKDGVYRSVEEFGLKTSKHVSVIRFDGVLYFANSGHFEDKLLKLIEGKKDLEYVIMDLEWMSDIDSSGLEVLELLIHRLESSKIDVYLTGLRVKIIEKFEKTGFLKEVGKKKIFVKISDAIDTIDDKHGKDIQTKSLEEYLPDKKSDGSEAKDIMKKYIRD